MHFKKRKKMIRAVILLAGALVTVLGVKTKSVRAAYELSDEQKAFVDQYYDICIELSAEYNTPVDVPLAQGILESASGQSDAAVTQNNFHGITSAKKDQTYKTYTSDEDGWRGYFENLVNTPSYSTANVFDYVDDNAGYLQALIRGCYNVEDGYFEYTMTIVNAVEAYREEKDLASTVEYQKEQEIIATNKEVEDRTLEARSNTRKAMEQEATDDIYVAKNGGLTSGVAAMVMDPPQS